MDGLTNSAPRILFEADGILLVSYGEFSEGEDISYIHAVNFVETNEGNPFLWGGNQTFPAHVGGKFWGMLFPPVLDSVVSHVFFLLISIHFEPPCL